MVRFISTLTIALLFIGVALAQPKPKATKTVAAKTETTVIQVPTVVCKSCASTVTKAVKKVDGVKSAKVDVKKKTATVTFVSEKATLAQLEKAIADAGYDANSTERNQAAFEKLDECCKIERKK